MWDKAYFEDFLLSKTEEAWSQEILVFTLVPRRSGDRLEDLGNICRQIKVQKADVDYVLMTSVICEPSPGWVAAGGTGIRSWCGSPGRAAVADKTLFILR